MYHAWSLGTFKFRHLSHSRFLSSHKSSISTNGNVSVHYNPGCGVRSSSPYSYGPSSAAASGSWYAMERSPTTGICIYFGPGPSTTLYLLMCSMVLDTMSTPAALGVFLIPTFPLRCAISRVISMIICRFFDTTLCARSEWERRCRLENTLGLFRFFSFGFHVNIAGG